MFRRKDPLYRTFTVLLSIIVFASAVLPVGALVAQPVAVPQINQPGFQNTDFDPYFSAAEQSRSESEYEAVVRAGRGAVLTQWELEFEAKIAAEVSKINHADNFNSEAEYRDYLRKALEAQYDVGRAQWELQADLAIEAERIRFLSNLSTQQRNDTVQRGESEVATGQQAVRGDADEARKRLDNAREEYEQTYQSGVTRTMQEYNTALAQIEADRAAFENSLSQAEQQFQQNFAQIQVYENTVRNAIGTAVTGLESQLQNSGLFYAETCDGENVCTTDSNTLNASGQTLQTLLTNLRDGLDNDQSLSTLAQQLQQYLAQREAQAIQNRDYWDALIYEDRALANEGTQPGHGLNFTLYQNTITGHVIDYLNGNTQPLIDARSSGHRVAQDFSGVDLRGNSPAHNPYPLSGLAGRTNQWWVADGAGTGALTYDAQGCGGVGFIVCLWNPGAPDGHPEFFVDLAGTYRLYDANAENNRDVWSQYATNLNTENDNWLNSILPAIQNWEAQVATYEASYSAWQAERTLLEQQNTQNYNQRVTDVSQNRNQYLSQIEQEYRDGLNQFAILERQLAANESQQALIEQQTAQLVRGGTLIQGGVTAAELIAASHLEKLQAPASINSRANLAIPDFTAAQQLLPAFQKTLSGALNVAVAENLHDDAKDTARKAAEELVGFARSLNDTTVTDAEVHAALAAQMEEYSFDVDPASIKLDWKQLEVTTQAEFEELQANTRKSIEERKQRQQFKSVEVLENGSIKITRDLSKGKTFLKAGGNNQNADDYIEELAETSFIIDGSGAAKLAQTAGLFDASFDANQALSDFEANKAAYQDSVHGAKLAAQAKINEQNALVEEMHKRAQQHTQMQVEMAAQMASLAQALITGGTIQSWVEGQMRSQVAGMIEDATGFPAGFISGLLGGMKPHEALKSYAEGVMMSRLDTALGLPPGSMSFLIGEQRKKSAAKSSPTAKLASNMASMGTAMGTFGGMAMGFLTGGPMGAMAGAAAGFAASTAIEPAMSTFYERNPMAMDAAAFATTAMTGNPAVWYTYQGVKGYHNGGALGAVTAMADTALMAVSYTTPVDLSVSYTDEGGFGASAGVGVKGVASVGLSYSDLNGVGASLSVGEAVGLGVSVATSQYGGSTVGLKVGLGFGEDNADGILSGGLSYNTKTGMGTNAGFSRGLAKPGSSGLGVSGNVGLNWNATHGFGADLGASLTHNPTQVSEYGDPNMGARSSPLSGTGLNLAVSEGEGLTLSGSMGSANIGSYNFDTGDFAYNENFANDAGRAALRSEYDRKQTAALLEKLDKAVIDNRDKMTDAEWEAFQKGELSPDDKAKLLKRINGEEGLANVSTDESSFGEGLLEDFAGKFVMLGETITGNNSGKHGYIDDAGEFHLRTCFVAGTLVRVKDGISGAFVENGRFYKYIEKVQANDLVLAKNEQTGEIRWSRVQEVFVRTTDRIYNIELTNGTVIETTWSHPFYVSGTGWVEARRLRESDLLVDSTDAEVAIRRIYVSAKSQTVFNFSVQNEHTYYVSDAEILVHNSDYSGPPPADIKAVRAKYELRVALTEEKLKARLGENQVEKVLDSEGRVIGFKDKVGSEIVLYDVDGKVVWREEPGMADAGLLDPVDTVVGGIFKKAAGLIGGAMFGGRKVGKSAVEVSEEGTRRMAQKADEAEDAIAAGAKKGSDNAAEVGSKTNKLRPEKQATGNHSTYARDKDGNVFKYETYEKTSTGHFNPQKRFDGGKPDGTPGKPHRNKQTQEQVTTPHVQNKNIPGGVRKPTPDELPKNPRFETK
jgi:hypothetical protein